MNMAAKYPGLKTGRTAKLNDDAKPRKPNKYHAKPTHVDGIRFDSRDEAARYGELKLLEQAGKISDLRVHPRYQLLDKNVSDSGRTLCKRSYVADFEYIEDGLIIVEDVKGMPLNKLPPLFKFKRDMFERIWRGYELRLIWMK